MRKKLSAILLVTACTMLFPITAQAGKWEQNDIGWWYDHQDGTWAANGWEWIDGRCYYFNEEGYCYMNPTAPTPDGYFVDASGAWVVDGVVQTQTEVVNAGNQSEDKTAELQAPFLGKWVRVAEYNTAGMYGNEVPKMINVKASGEKLAVEVYLRNAQKPSVTNMLIYEEPYWVEEEQNIYTDPSNYVIDDETGRLIAFHATASENSMYVQEYERYSD